MTEPHLTRALRDLVREPVVPPALGRRVADAHARRRRRRAAVASVAAVAAVVGGATLLPSSGREPSTAVTAGPSARTLGADGNVVAKPGEPVRFCKNEPRTLLPDAASTPPGCNTSVTVTGVDLDDLSGREERDGVVWGGAWLEGTYADGVLTVVRQEAPRNERDPDPTGAIPCPRPEGGWPAAPPETVREPSPALAYQMAHPDLVVGRRKGWDGGQQVQIVTATDVARVEADLKPVYGGALCVVASRYTAEQVDAAIQDVAAFLKMPWLTQADIDDEAQVHMDVPVAVADAEAEALVARHPDGLVRLDPWLRPVP